MFLLALVDVQLICLALKSSETIGELEHQLDPGEWASMANVAVDLGDWGVLAMGCCKHGR